MTTLNPEALKHSTLTSLLLTFASFALALDGGPASSQDFYSWFEYEQTKKQLEKECKIPDEEQNRLFSPQEKERMSKFLKNIDRIRSSETEPLPSEMFEFRAEALSRGGDAHGVPFPTMYTDDRIGIKRYPVYSKDPLEPTTFINYELSRVRRLKAREWGAIRGVRMALPRICTLYNMVIKLEADHEELKNTVTTLRTNFRRHMHGGHNEIPRLPEHQTK